MLKNKKQIDKKILKELWYHFTLDGRIKVINWFFDDRDTLNQGYYTKKYMDSIVDKVRLKQTIGYADIDRYLYEALEIYPIKNKKVVVMGSNIPRYEILSLLYGADTSVIEYNKIFSEITEIKYYTVKEYDSAEGYQKFDVGFSFSSFEHDGLGRYGDPIDPYGDVKAMEKMKLILKKDGLLFLAVPAGIDKLFWNAHRQYGNIRFPLLVYGWELLDILNDGRDIIFSMDNGKSQHLHCFVILRNI